MMKLIFKKAKKKKKPTPTYTITRKHAREGPFFKLKDTTKGPKGKPTQQLNFQQHYKKA